MFQICPLFSFPQLSPEVPNCCSRSHHSSVVSHSTIVYHNM
jgi:hypothetical protein